MPNDKKLPSKRKKGKSLNQLKTEASQKMGAASLTGRGFDVARKAVGKVKQRKTANRKLRNVAKNLKNRNFSIKNKFRSEDNKKIKKSKVKRDTDPSKGAEGFMRKAQMQYDGRQLLKKEQ